MRVHLEVPSIQREAEFLVAVRQSRALHGPLASPPRTPGQYRAYLDRIAEPTHRGYFVCLSSEALAGVINVNEIVRGRFRSGYLGYYVLAPHAAKGYMALGLRLVISRTFRRDRLHRLEANVQPDNVRSISLVKGLGFRLEGLSRRYLKVGGQWRDHERWALTVEDWKRR